MATEAVAHSLLGNLFRESAMGHNQGLQVARSGDLVGWSFSKLSDQSITGTFCIPTGTLTTGLTFKLATVDDGSDANDLGKVVRFGITVKRLADGETGNVDSGAATEQTVDVTLESTSGNITINTLAIANANLDSAAVADIVAIRVRRIGSHANDTCQGRVLLVGLAVYGT